MLFSPSTIINVHSLLLECYPSNMNSWHIVGLLNDKFYHFSDDIITFKTLYHLNIYELILFLYIFKMNTVLLFQL